MFNFGCCQLNVPLFHWATPYHKSPKFKLNFCCRKPSSDFFFTEKKEKRFICIQRQLILSYGSNENVPCLEMDIISILQVCSAWSYNFLRFQSHFPQNSLCCRSPPSTWFPPFLILLFCLIPQFFTFPIFFLQVFLFLILLFAKTLFCFWSPF